MTTIKMNYEGNVNDGLIKFVEGLKTSTYDKMYNSICLNVVSLSDRKIYQVDRCYGADLTKVDFESELYGMIHDDELNDCSLLGEFIFEIVKYKSSKMELEHKKLESFFNLVLEINGGIDSIIDFLDNKDEQRKHKAGRKSK